MLVIKEQIARSSGKCLDVVKFVKFILRLLHGVLCAFQMRLRGSSVDAIDVCKIWLRKRNPKNSHIIMIAGYSSDKY